MYVRSNGNSGKLLFEWNPEKNVIAIVKCGTIYKIKLFNSVSRPYKIIDQHPYNPPNNSK